MVGKFVNLDENKRKKSRLDVGRVYPTISSLEPVNKAIQVIINKKIYSIRLIEDVFRFLVFNLNTDCALPVAEVTSSEDSKTKVESRLAFSNAAAELGEVGLAIRGEMMIFNQVQNSKFYLTMWRPAMGVIARWQKVLQVPRKSTVIAAW